jgi:hypothetical protein
MPSLYRKARTFCFADAETVQGGKSQVDVVDTTKPPGKDESAFLAGLLTAVCRPGLFLAPGLLLHAAAVSGSGTGKRLLARCIYIIAYGRPPSAITAGANDEELEKRISTELISGAPALFLDNMNGRSLRSDLLASVITERSASVRILGKSESVLLNATAFVILTGNALRLSEDLTRRFIEVAFDAHMEDPEERPFAGDIRAEVCRAPTGVAGGSSYDLAVGQAHIGHQVWPDTRKLPNLV